MVDALPVFSGLIADLSTHVTSRARLLEDGAVRVLMDACVKDSAELREDVAVSLNNLSNFRDGHLQMVKQGAVEAMAALCQLDRDALDEEAAPMIAATLRNLVTTPAAREELAKREKALPTLFKLSRSVSAQTRANVAVALHNLTETKFLRGPMVEKGVVPIFIRLSQQAKNNDDTSDDEVTQVCTAALQNLIRHIKQSGGMKTMDRGLVKALLGMLNKDMDDWEFDTRVLAPVMPPPAFRGLKPSTRETGWLPNEIKNLTPDWRDVTVSGVKVITPEYPLFDSPEPNSHVESSHVTLDFVAREFDKMTVANEKDYLGMQRDFEEYKTKNRESPTVGMLEGGEGGEALENGYGGSGGGSGDGGGGGEMTPSEMELEANTKPDIWSNDESGMTAMGLNVMAVGYTGDNSGERDDDLQAGDDWMEAFALEDEGPADQSGSSPTLAIGSSMGGGYGQEEEYAEDGEDGGIPVRIDPRTGLPALLPLDANWSSSAPASDQMGRGLLGANTSMSMGNVMGGRLSSGNGNGNGNSAIWPGSGFTFPEDVAGGPAALTTNGLVSSFESTPAMARKAHTNKSKNKNKNKSQRKQLGRLSSSPLSDSSGSRYVGGSSMSSSSSSNSVGRYQRKKKIIRGEKMMADMQMEFLDVQRIVEQQKVRREERVVGDYLTMINRVRTQGSKSAPKSLSKSQSFFY